MLILSRYSWWMGAMAALAIFLAAAGRTGVLSPFQGVFLTVTSPLERLTSGVFSPIAAFLADAGNIDDLQDENRRLRLEVEDLNNRLIGAEQDRERVKELEAAAGIIEESASGSLLTASVLFRTSSPLSASVSIDKGSNDGVIAGMVVLSSNGTLFGTVTETFADRSFVRLVTDSKSKIAAQVLESRADGIIRGGAQRTLTFDFAQADIAAGDTIVTSGLGGNYPADLPIGRVTEVSGSSQDLFRKVTVEPLVRLSTANTVLVLTSFLPQRADIAGSP
jgi:rod shape-determining protein MreC